MNNIVLKNKYTKYNYLKRNERSYDHFMDILDFGMIVEKVENLINKYIHSSKKKNEFPHRKSNNVDI